MHCSTLLYVYKIYCELFSEEVNDETEFTLENINTRLCGKDPQENFRNLWKTSFDEGISREDVLKDEDLMKREHKQWRYDYSFRTKSGNTCSKYCELLYKYCKALSKYVHEMTYNNLRQKTKRSIQQQQNYAKKWHEARRKKLHAIIYYIYRERCDFQTR